MNIVFLGGSEIHNVVPFALEPACAGFAHADKDRHLVHDVHDLRWVRPVATEDAAHDLFQGFPWGRQHEGVEPFHVQPFLPHAVRREENVRAGLVFLPRALPRLGGLPNIL